MKVSLKGFLFLLLMAALCSCSNMPVTPTKTPTMSPEEMMKAAEATAEALRKETETQWAIDNPSPTPTDTATPTPEATPTNPKPVIPPTATDPPRPYLSVGYTTHTIYKVGDPGNWNDFVPMDTLYVEVCYTNEGSGIWNENYYCMCSNPNGTIISPQEPVRLGKSVGTGEKACFSFQRIGDPNTALRQYCPMFQLYNDQGTPISRGQEYACFTIH